MNGITPQLGKPEILTEDELRDMSRELPPIIDRQHLARLERVAKTQIFAHAASFNERIPFAFEIATCAGEATLAHFLALEHSEQLQLATYLYQFVDCNLKWEQAWGRTYNAREIKQIFMGALLDLDPRLPDDALILDVGSGIQPLGTLLLDGRPNRKVVAVDIAVPEDKVEVDPQILLLRLDINLIAQNTSEAVQIAVREAKNFARKPLAFDVIVLGDILNYIDAEAVLKRLLPFIKPGGFLAVCSHAGLYSSPTHLYGAPVDLTNLWPDGQIPGFVSEIAIAHPDSAADNLTDAFAIFRKL